MEEEDEEENGFSWQAEPFLEPFLEAEAAAAAAEVAPSATSARQAIATSSRNGSACQEEA